MQNRIIFLRLFSGDEPEREDAVFLEARRAFFENPEADGGRVLRKEYEANGARYVCQYRFSGKKPVWIVREGRRAVQKIANRKDGSYAVLTLDKNGAVVREELYSAADAWMSVTEYRDGMLTASAKPGGEGCLVAQQIISEDRSVRNLRLIACPAVKWDDKDALQAVTREYGLPQAVAFTQSGALCYYEERMAEQANRCGLRYPARATYVATEMKEHENEPAPAEEEALRPGSLFDEILGLDAEKTVEDMTGKGFAEQSAEESELPSAEELFSVAEQELSVEPPVQPQEQAAPPSLEELFPEETSAPEAEHTEQPDTERRVFEGEDRTLLLEFSGDGTQVYAGGIRAGECDGFGAAVDLQEKYSFTGVWLYGGRSGVRTAQNEDGMLRVRFEDSASQNPETPEGESCVFGTDGEITFAGRMAGDQRNGFGMAKWGTRGHRYVGAWQEDKPNGRGIELDENGGLIYEGEWKNGVRDGFGTEFVQGKPVYSGNWSNNERGSAAPAGEAYEGEFSGDVRSGSGSLLLPSGGRIDGSFENGELVGTAVEYNAAGAMVYRGGFSGTVRTGRGTLFENGEAVYEGEFARGRFHGNGKQMENGSTVYVGAFADGARCGVGASFRNGKPVYFGQWANGVRHGCGVEYHCGEPVFAGCFENGIRSGRVNEYRGGKLFREMVCRNGEPIYMLEYGADGEPEYIGAVYDGERSGMGRLLGKNCESKEQGIFSGGRLAQPVSVLVQPIEALECPDELRGSTYETLANPKQRCVVEMPYQGGQYSGHWHDGKPEGGGTLLFADHCYTGSFENGVPCGKGRLYLSTGKTIEGVFAAQGGERIACGGREYFVTCD